MDKIRTIIDKEWAEVFKNRIVLFTVVFMPLLFTAIPLVLLIAMRGQSGVGDATDMPPQFMQVCGALSGVECFQLFMVNQFLLLFMMMPLTIPIAIAAYSIVGEKTTHCLEPLLATPISTAELLIGKGAAACIPGVVATWIGFAIFAAGTFVIVPSRLMVARILDPMWLVAIFLVGPLMALAAVSLAIIVSARVSDPRTAEQVSMVIILPLMGLFFAQIAGVILVNMQVLLLVALLMALVDVGLVYLGVRAFQRETILTKWK